jgi:hypothetical protein
MFQIVRYPYFLRKLVNSYNPCNVKSFFLCWNNQVKVHRVFLIIQCPRWSRPWMPFLWVTSTSMQFCCCLLLLHWRIDLVEHEYTVKLCQNWDAVSLTVDGYWLMLDGQFCGNSRELPTLFIRVDIYLACLSIGFSNMKWDCRKLKYPN